MRKLVGWFVTALALLLAIGVLLTIGVLEARDDLRYVAYHEALRTEMQKIESGIRQRDPSTLAALVAWYASQRTEIDREAVEIDQAMRSGAGPVHSVAWDAYRALAIPKERLALEQEIVAIQAQDSTTLARYENEVRATRLKLEASAPRPSVLTVWFGKLLAIDT